VRRELLLYIVPGVIRGKALTSECAHISNELFAAGTVIKRGNHTLRNAWIAVKGGFYFAQFNAKASYFDLVIDPAETLKFSVATVSGDVSSFIETVTGTGIGKRIRYEALRCQFGPIQISTS